MEVHPQLLIYQLHSQGKSKKNFWRISYSYWINWRQTTIQWQLSYLYQRGK